MWVKKGSWNKHSWPKEKRRHRGNQPYCEMFFMSYMKTNHVCVNCNFACKLRSGAGTLASGKGIKCPNCHKENSMFNTGMTARPPRKNASKRTWRRFWEMFKNGSHPSGCR